MVKEGKTLAKVFSDLDKSIIDSAKILLKAAIDKTEWTKTDYLMPHEYIVCKYHPALCAAIKAQIALEGYSGTFQGRTYIYIDINDYYYWAFDTIVNRRLLSLGGNKSEF